MIRPSLFSYAIGNLFSCMVILCLAAYMLFQAWDLYQHRETICWLVGVIALMMGSSALKANTRISNYNDWRSDWQGVSGEQREASERKRGRTSLVLFTAAGWVGLAYWLSIHAGQGASATDNYVAAIFGLVTLLGIFLGVGLLALRLVRWVRRRGNAADAKRELNHIVSACLPVPGDSAQPNQITAALPSYCKPLLQSTSDPLYIDRRS